MDGLRLVAALASAALVSPRTQAQQHLVVPPAYHGLDAVSYEWIAGASSDLRQQTLVGASHLHALVGRDLWAVELRRTAANEVYLGGTTDLTVTVSTSPSIPLACTSAFAGNVGPDAVQVFAGPVTIPTSPAVAGGPGSAVAWTPANIVRIAFQQPFRYRGGTLCIDVLGRPVPGQQANWWMADAEFEDISGTAVEIGIGCGAYGGPQGQWSHVATRPLLPGAHARFWAYGVPNGFAIAVFGQASPTPIPLSAFGIAAPGCNCHLLPATILSAVVATYEPEVHPLLRQNGHAEVRLRIPNSTWTFGLQLSTQWFDLAQPATSNAFTWTIASVMPTLDMALIEGHPAEASGEVTVHLAHVMRFEYR